MMNRLIPFAAILLASCGESKDSANEDSGAPLPTSQASTEPQPPLGGIELEVIENEEMAGVTGDLGCSFSADGRPYLLAAGDLGEGSRITGIVKRDGEIVRLAGKGGYEALAQGTTLTGGGLKITLVRGTKLPQQSALDDNVHVATLQSDDADGSRKSYYGRWNCGA